MTSINTNISAKAALASLRAIDTSLGDAQNRAASGLRIGKAADNAAYWSIATTLRSDMATRVASDDALNMSLGLVDTAYSGVSRSIELLDQMKQKFVMALSATDDDKLKLEGEIASIRDALVSVTKSSSFAGDNWLYKSSTTQSNTRSLVSGVTRNSDGTVSVQKTTVDLSSILLIDTSVNVSTVGLLSRANSSTSGVTAFVYTRHIYVKSGSGQVTVVATAGTPAANARNAILASTRIIDMVTQDLTNAAATLGALRSGLDIQKSASESMSKAEKRALGTLVDADMNETSARLRAAQARQQLAYQTLNIANGSPGTILQLFR